MSQWSKFAVEFYVASKRNTLWICICVRAEKITSGNILRSVLIQRKQRSVERYGPLHFCTCQTKRYNYLNCIILLAKNLFFLNVQACKNVLCTIEEFNDLAKRSMILDYKKECLLESSFRNLKTNAIFVIITVLVSFFYLNFD